jgi:hypothetical protein
MLQQQAQNALFSEVLRKTVADIIRQCHLPCSPCGVYQNKHVFCAGALYVRAALWLSQGEEEARAFENRLLASKQTADIVTTGADAGLPIPLMKIFIQKNDSLDENERVVGILSYIATLDRELTNS